MSDELESQVALVTGATQGIGRATALALAGAGFKVAVLARTSADVGATVSEIESRGGVAHPIVADVANPDDVEGAFSKLVAEFSTLDVLVNNAGTGIRKPFLHTTRGECDSLVDLNLRGLVNCTRAALHHMQPQGRGCIVNIASRAARLPEPDMAVYSATKAAVVAFSLALAREVDGAGVRIVTICPGPVDTQRIRRLAPDADRHDWLTPEDVANAVLFLSSSMAVRYNGAILDLFK
jgi:NAD(P)-dependent dehydrogenase (short-subunit alcohol dehydrogenase family)